MSWAPNETASLLWAERANLDGIQLGDVTYGVYVVLFFMCFSALWDGRTASPRHSYIMMAYTAVVFALTTVGNAMQMRDLELVLVDNRNYPGGPMAYAQEQGSRRTLVPACTAVFTVSAWLADGLLLYRFWVIWNSHWAMLVLPAGAYLLSIASSCLMLSQITQPGKSLWHATNADFALLFWASSIALTFFVTLAIVARLLRMRLQLRRTMAAGADGAAVYLSVSAMLVESAALYTSVALVFLVTYVRGDTFNFVVFPALGNVQAIAPLLIVLRVAQGRGWTRGLVRDAHALSTGVGGSLWFARCKESTGLGPSIAIPDLDGASSVRSSAGAGVSEDEVMEREVTAIRKSETGYVL